MPESSTLEARKLPPVWLLGFTNATFGMFGGFSVVTVAEMLAAQGVSGDRIASIVATILSPGIWIFLVAPILDVRFSRRSYALVFSLLAAVSVAVAVIFRGHVGLLEAVMVAGSICVGLVQGAVGGWMGSLIRKNEDGALGAWFAVSNIGSGGVMMVIAGELIQRLNPITAGTLLGTMIMLPSLLYFYIPSIPPDDRLASESFRQFFRDILALLKRREVLIALALFLLPASSFALTNVLGGIGKDFSATERMVSLFGGVGSAVAGVVGSLLLPPLARKMALRPLYLAVGIAGGVFTLSLLLMPHTPLVFGIAITGENLFQALAFATSNAITFETMGQDNPLAATQFSLLVAATNLPIIYMGFIDGAAYKWHAVIGSFAADASISIVICLLLAWGLSIVGHRSGAPAHS
jgi:PAT family beta-lactamase induction signal transducer AmpG